ncbi:hypothetical protein [uncultured Acetobacteroides sp.]|uniref:hypothetical protein n=1 Tax=uncultured Acetobacteroides sp. TaxID=1760811 RepID=UPI0029F53F98|nr:hypothetical protein [uncultured Acetobacteroides sp.]
MKSIFGFIRHLFQKKRGNSIEPLLHSNAERLFGEWSSGFGISVPPSSRPLRLADVVGSYAVSGSNPSTTSEGYFGTLQLEPCGALVKAYWEIGHTHQPQHGVGFLKNDLLALDFYYAEAGERFYGQAIYRVAGDRLVGFWREHADGRIAPEVATLKNRLV